MISQMSTYIFILKSQDEDEADVKQIPTTTKKGTTRRDNLSKGASGLGGALFLLGMGKKGGIAKAASASPSTERLKEDYNTYAAGYDTLDGGPLSKLLGLEGARSELIQQANGQVLEVAVGTGLNLQYYAPVLSKIKSIDAIDLSPGMLNEVGREGRLCVLCVWMLS